MKQQPWKDALVRDLSFHREMEKREGFTNLFELPFPGNSAMMPTELIKRFPDIEEAFSATVSMILQSECCSRAYRMAKALELCQSPIEAKFLLSLVCACSMNDLSVSVLEDEEEAVLTTKGADEDMRLFVTPQAEIAGYHVDFALELYFTDPFHMMAAMFGRPKPTNTPETVIQKLAIECDGHEFHEKTATQAKRDKSRDRELLAEGYPVMRFTGSEIFQTPLKCANQVVRDFFEINK